MLRKTFLILIALGAIECSAQGRFTPLSISVSSENGSFIGGFDYFTPPLQNVENQYFSSGITTIVALSDQHVHTTVTDTAVAATCTTSGLTEGTHCSVCGDTIVAQTIIPATGHTPSTAVVENKIEPTNTKEGSYENVVYCSVCKQELSRTKITMPIHTHNADSFAIVNRIEPTCTIAGSYDSVRYCTICALPMTTDTISIPATGHTIVIDKAVAATDSTTGLTEGSHCSVCGDTIVAQEVIPIISKPITDTIINDTIINDTIITDTIKTDTINKTIVNEESISIARIFPNPVADILNIDTDIDCICLIYNANGNLVLRRKLDEGKQISLSQLAPGNYILTLVKDNKSIVSTKIIKQ